MRTRSLLVLAVVTVLALVVPSTATAESVPQDAIPLEGGGYAVELGAPAPDWYTPDLHQRVLAAGAAGVPIPDEADIPASALAWTGIRPGAWMFFPSWCTMNFVFGGTAATTETPTKAKGNGKGGKTATAPGGGGSGWYIGTAGHCTDVGDEVTLIAAPGLLMNIGRTVKSYNDEIGQDFALIEIYPEMVRYINPSMAIIGGPTATAAPAFGDPVAHVGHGLGVGTGGTPRAGVVTYTGNGDQNQPTAYGWVGAANLGDSGSGVRNAATGAAVGNLTHLVVGTDYLPSYIAGTTAPHMEALAGARICYGSLISLPAPTPTCG